MVALLGHCRGLGYSKSTICAVDRVFAEHVESSLQGAQIRPVMLGTCFGR